MKPVNEYPFNFLLLGETIINEIDQCDSVNDLVAFAIEGCKIDKIEFYPVKHIIAEKQTDGSVKNDIVFYAEEEIKNNLSHLILKIPAKIGNPFGQNLAHISNSFFKKLITILQSIESTSNNDIIKQISTLEYLITDLRFEREYFEKFNLFMLPAIKISVIVPGKYEFEIFPPQIISSENFRKTLFDDSRNKFDFFSTLILLLERTSMLLKHKVKEYRHKVGFKNENAGRRLLYEIFFTLKNTPGYFEISDADVFRTNLFRVFNLSDTVPSKKGQRGESYFLSAILSQKENPNGKIKKLEELFLRWHKGAYRKKKSKK